MSNSTPESVSSPAAAEAQEKMAIDFIQSLW
jgi:hypothetical protein